MWHQGQRRSAPNWWAVGAVHALVRGEGAQGRGWVAVDRMRGRFVTDNELTLVDPPGKVWALSQGSALEVQSRLHYYRPMLPPLLLPLSWLLSPPLAPWLHPHPAGVVTRLLSWVSAAAPTQTLALAPPLRPAELQTLAASLTVVAAVMVTQPSAHHLHAQTLQHPEARGPVLHCHHLA
jgi:hypothetical protein